MSGCPRPVAVFVAALAAAVAAVAPSASADTTNDNNGTALSLLNVGGNCQDGVLALSGTIVSSGSDNPAQILVSVDSGPPVQVGVVSNWVYNGRYKSASFAVSVNVPNGSHTAVLTFVQSSEGRTQKTVSTVAMGCTAPPP